MKVLLVSADFPPNIGGVATHVANLAVALAGHGAEVHVLTLPLGRPAGVEEYAAGVTMHRLKMPKMQPFYDWSMRAALKRFAADLLPDVIHVHGIRPLTATRGLPVPVIFTNHTSGFLQRLEKGEAAKARIAKRLTHVRAVLAPSEELVEATRAVGYDGPSIFIPNGVDTDVFKPGPSGFRQEHGIADDEVVVLLARRLVEKNGVIYFAEAAAALRGERVRLVLAGDGADRSRVEEILTRGGMRDKALFLGSVPNERMPDVYRGADMSVLPSLKEATSITGLESMATGLPLVATDVGGIPYLVQDGRTGLLVPSADPQALGQAMLSLVRDGARRKEMGRLARERAVAEFSWFEIARATMDAYVRYAGAD